MPEALNTCYLGDKGILKQECKRLGIPTSRFLVVDFHQRRPVESIIKELEQEIDVYPMFRKPVVGFGSGGGGRVDNPKELKEWLHEMIGQPVVNNQQLSSYTQFRHI